MPSASKATPSGTSRSARAARVTWPRRLRTVTGSVGAKEALIQDEFEIEDLKELDDFFSKIAQVKMHADWGKKMSEVIVSGSTHWQVFRVVQ